jgi:hypothetical protein
MQLVRKKNPLDRKIAWSKTAKIMSAKNTAEQVDFETFKRVLFAKDSAYKTQLSDFVITSNSIQIGT